MPERASTYTARTERSPSASSPLTWTFQASRGVARAWTTRLGACTRSLSSRCFALALDLAAALVTRGVVDSFPILSFWATEVPRIWPLVLEVTTKSPPMTGSPL